MSASNSRSLRSRMPRLFVIALIGSTSLLAGAVSEFPAEPIKVSQASGQAAPRSMPVAIPVAVPVATATPVVGRFTVRCWQYGKLLFEETLSQLPTENDAVTIRMQGADRASSPYQLLDTRTAMCLVKPTLDKGGAPIGAVPSR